MYTPLATTDNDPFGSNRNSRDGNGHIIIRLTEKQTHDSNDLGELAQTEEFESLRSFLAKNAHLSAERVIRHVAPDVIREREGIAGATSFAPIETLTAYWRIDVRQEASAEIFRRELHNMPEISVAYHESSIREACSQVVAAGANPYFGKQDFLNANPQGIGAREAWSKGNCDGSGVNAIDVEAGWITAHQDLPKPQLLYGDNGCTDRYVTGDHGAAALGIVGGVNNDIGIIGIVPNVDSLNAVSHYDAAKKTGLHVADAIDAATKHLNRGDILLLEVQRIDGGNAYPTEIESADLHAIRLAVAHGIIVIEAAGNGSQDLDLWSDPTGQHSLRVNSSGYADSGAIMVGSAYASVVPDPGGYQGHKRYYTSNYGARVNVYAWGESIYTAGYGNIAGKSGAINSFTSNFGQTSGASAIIAGAAALVQSWYKSAFGEALTPEEMRNILSNPETSTPQALVSNDSICVMPDVGAIISVGVHRQG